MAIKRGARVRLVQPIIEGEVLYTEANGDDFGYRVKFKTPDGQEHERFFNVAEIEEVEVPVEIEEIKVMSTTDGALS